MNVPLAIAIGYLFGSVPFAFVLTRARGVDLRKVGSRNLGAANVLRTLGVVAAITVMLLDVAKGALAVLVVRAITTSSWASVAAGLAAIVGHIYPVWLGFHGG